jgi:hypothetical protein
VTRLSVASRDAEVDSQIAGPRGRRGVWNRQEYLPGLIASSV